MAVWRGSGTLAFMSVGWLVVKLVELVVCMLAVLNSATTTEFVLVALVTDNRRMPSSKPVPASIRCPGISAGPGLYLHPIGVAGALACY